MRVEDREFLLRQFEKIEQSVSDVRSTFSVEPTETRVHLAANPVEFSKILYLERRQRDRLIKTPEIFSEPAWDILLDLFARQQEDQCTSISSACIASNVAPTTALRWLKVLEEKGAVTRAVDPTDSRRSNLTMSDLFLSRMEEYLRHCEQQRRGG